MLPVSQAQFFGDIRLEGQGNSLTINQIVQIAVAEVKMRPFVASSPFLGLRRFEERNKDVFFGRDRLVGELLQLVARRNLVLLAGASGSGKSSVVRAGLLPQLAARLPQGCFRSLVMTPDRDPFSSLRGALQGAGVAQESLDALESRTSDSIVKTLTLHRPEGDSWLLFVDQFEEIFTRCVDTVQREAFLTGLTKLAEAPQRDFKIILCMRADFFDRLGPHAEFGALAQQGVQLALDMQASELRAAIEQPASRHGVVFEEGLVEQIIADVKGRPGALPLLQYTLDLLWRADNPADDRTLNAKSYHQIGGIEGALRLRADTIFRFDDARRQTSRTPAQQEAMRKIFLGVVDLTSQGTEARAVSRRASLSDFPRPEERQLISELIDEKLLVSDAALPDENGNSDRSGTIEIAHEALLSAWPQLKGWIEQAREVIYVRNRLSADARRFVEMKARVPSRADDELWGGSRLQQTLELRARGDFKTVLGGLTAEEEIFLDASAHKKRDEQTAKEKAEQELRDAHEQVRQHLLSTYVEQGRQLLFEKQRPGEALLWLHRAMDGRSAHPGLLDLLKSAGHSIGVRQTVLAGHGNRVSCATYSPDGCRILTASDDYTARVWESDTGCLIAELKGHEARVVSARYSPDGCRILTASEDMTARVWMADTGRCLVELQGHLNGLVSATYSPDGRRILTASADQTARVWNAETGLLIVELKSHESSLLGAAYSPNGRSVVTASLDKTARVWDAESGFLIAELKGHLACVVSVMYSPDSRRILTASFDKTARVWNAESGDLIAELKGHEDMVVSAAYSPDGCSIVTASFDKTARVWKAWSGSLVAELKGHEARVNSATYSPNGRRIVTTSEDLTARVWEAESGRLIAELKGHEQLVDSATYHPEGRRLVTVSNDHTARVWEAEDGRLVAELKGHDASVVDASYSPDGRHIVTASEDLTARVWEAKSGRLIVILNGHRQIVRSAAYSPDSRRIVTASEDTTARVWEAESGCLIAELKGHRHGVQSATYSPDGRRVVTVSQGPTARLWEAETGRLIAELKGHRASVLSATYSPDSRRIITASEDQKARVWDADTGCLVAELTGHSASYRPGARCIVTVSPENTVLVWEAETGRLTAITELAGYGGRVNSATYSPDSRHVVTVSVDKKARVWGADSGRLMAEFKGHLAGIVSAMYSPDGRRIVTVSEDLTLGVWESETGRLTAELKGHGATVCRVTYGPDSRHIVSASADKTARVWDVSEETRSASEIAQSIRCYVPLRFVCEDSDVMVHAVPDPRQCQRGDRPS